MQKVNFEVENPMFFVKTYIDRQIEELMYNNNSTVYQKIDSHSYRFILGFSYDEIESWLTKFFENSTEKEIMITIDVLEKFWDYLKTEIKRTKSYENCRRKQMLYFLSSYVFDKNTNKIIQCSTGEHELAIMKHITSFLNKKYPKSNYNFTFVSDIPLCLINECEDYFTNNLILKGGFKEKYI